MLVIGADYCMIESTVRLKVLDHALGLVKVDTKTVQYRRPDEYIKMRFVDNTCNEHAMYHII